MDHSWFSDRRMVALALLLMLPQATLAADFVVTGIATMNGNAGALPANSFFAGSAYDGATGAIASGSFTFPQTTSSNGSTVVTWRMEQTNTSSGQVASDGVAALTDASFKLTVLSASLGGFPIPLGTCVFQPITIGLSGTVVQGGLDLADEQFDIHETPPGNCGSVRDQINATFAGSNNRIDLHLAGDFTPPGANDRIFVDGFEAGVRRGDAP